MCIANLFLEVQSEVVEDSAGNHYLLARLKHEIQACPQNSEPRLHFAVDVFWIGYDACQSGGRERERKT